MQQNTSSPPFSSCQPLPVPDPVTCLSRRFRRRLCRRRRRRLTTFTAYGCSGRRLISETPRASGYPDFAERQGTTAPLPALYRDEAQGPVDEIRRENQVLCGSRRKA